MRFRLLCLVGTLAAIWLVSATSTAEAGGHWHRIWSAAWGEMRDPPPFYDPSPNEPCGPNTVGKVVKVFDKRLGGFVKWRCFRRDDGSYAWHRLPGVHEATYTPFWQAQPRRIVFDWHRACKSIVCLKIGVAHNYPTDVVW